MNQAIRNRCRIRAEEIEAARVALEPTPAPRRKVRKATRKAKGRRR